MSTLGTTGRDQFRVPQHAFRGPPRDGLIEGGRGDLDPVLGEHATDRLDPDLLPVIIDEVDQNLVGRSSSAAKEAEAAFTISLARRSSGTSFFSALIAAISSLVLPGRTPPSTSACRIHLRNDSVEVMPNFAATDPIAAASCG